MRSSLREWVRKLPPVPGEEPLETHMIELSFDHLDDPEDRAYFHDLPTGFNLDDEAVSRLVAAGRRLLRELMFPTDPRLILLGGAAAGFLLVFRIPTVSLCLLRTGLSRRHRAMMTFAYPRGIASGVLSAVPLQYGLENYENLSPGVFSLIVFSLLIFASGWTVLRRMPRSSAPQAKQA